MRWLFVFLIAPLAAVEYLTLEIVHVWPHDPNAFTQGLVFVGDQLYESVGLYGQSELRQIEPETGQVIRRRKLPSRYFAEGIASIGNGLIQLTWKEGKAFVYDLQTLAVKKKLWYNKEGWGLCFDGRDLWMSHGTAVITKHDPQTLAITGYLQVQLDHQDVSRLNDLECVNDILFANVWKENFIVRIDKHTGTVTGIISLQPLLHFPHMPLSNPEYVPNGIAYHPHRQTLWITGKCWPWLFEVRLISQGKNEKSRDTP
jgi:glutaminyl-peptide cyclotransferase